MEESPTKRCHHQYPLPSCLPACHRARMTSDPCPSRLDKLVECVMLLMRLNTVQYRDPHLLRMPSTWISRCVRTPDPNPRLHPSDISVHCRSHIRLSESPRWQSVHWSPWKLPSLDRVCKRQSPSINTVSALHHILAIIGGVLVFLCNGIGHVRYSKHASRPSCQLDVTCLT